MQDPGQSGLGSGEDGVVVAAVVIMKVVGVVLAALEVICGLVL